MSNKKVRVTFNKLVRDKQSPFMQEPGIVIHSRILDRDEFIVELKKKLIEESYEAVTAQGEEFIEEIADLQEILDALITACNIVKEEFCTLRQKKLDTRGGFKKRIFISYVDIPRDSEAFEYCIQQSDKYPMQEIDDEE